MPGWFLAHFPSFFSIDDDSDYIPNYLIAAKWAIHKDHGEGLTYRSLLDHFGFDDVTWRSYEKHKEI